MNFLEDSGHCVFTWVSRKTDRLEQRQAAGKSPGGFSCFVACLLMLLTGLD